MAPENITLESHVLGLLNPLLNAVVLSNIGITSAVDSGDRNQNFGNPMEMLNVAMQNLLREFEEEDVDGDGFVYFGELMTSVTHEYGGDTRTGWAVALLMK